MQIRNVNNNYQPTFGALKGVIIGENYKSFVGNKGVQRTLNAINSNGFFDEMFQSKNGYIRIDREIERFNQLSAASKRVVTNTLSIFFKPEKQGFFSKLLNTMRPYKKFDLIEEIGIDCAWENREIDEYKLMNRFLSRIRNYDEYDLHNFVGEFKNFGDGFARVRNTHKRNGGCKTTDNFGEDTYAYARKSHKAKGGYSGYRGYRTSDEMVDDAFKQAKKTHKSNSDYRTSEKLGEDATKRVDENQSTKRKSGWTKEQFIAHIQVKIEKRGFRKADLKDVEVRNLAKLLGTTEEQVRNMDKQEYRRLSIKFHPDSAEKGNENIFCILNNLYNCI